MTPPDREFMVDAKQSQALAAICYGVQEAAERLRLRNGSICDPNMFATLKAAGVILEKFHFGLLGIALKMKDSKSKFGRDVAMPEWALKVIDSGIIEYLEQTEGLKPVPKTEAASEIETKGADIEHTAA